MKIQATFFRTSNVDSKYNKLTKPSFLANPETMLRKAKALSHTMVKDEIALCELKNGQSVSASPKSLSNFLLMMRQYLNEKRLKNLSKNIEINDSSFVNDNFINKTVMNCITGFNREKESLERNFIAYIMKNRRGLFSDKIPGAVLICGNDSNISKVLSGIKAELNGAVNIIENPEVSQDNFETDMQKLLLKSREHYFNTGERTMPIFQDVENFLSMSLEEAKDFGFIDTLEDGVLESLKDKHNFDKISFFKSILDDVSDFPDENEKMGYSANSALSFIMTSKNPHLITPDLSQRDGKMPKFFFGMLEGRNLKDVILESIIKFNKRFVDTFQDKTWDILVKAINPNLKQGGYSLDSIVSCIQRFYVQNKEKSQIVSNFHLACNLLNNPRDISPKEYKKNLIIKDHFGLDLNDVSRYLQDWMEDI